MKECQGVHQWCKWRWVKVAKDGVVTMTNDEHMIDILDTLNMTHYAYMYDILYWHIPLIWSITNAWMTLLIEERVNHDQWRIYERHSLLKGSPLPMKDIWTIFFIKERFNHDPWRIYERHSLMKGSPRPITNIWTTFFIEGFTMTHNEYINDILYWRVHHDP